ncbi:hypothetical protein RS130_18870 [Paraglaciecola aquimarina]|uniref:Uncharacterized protein n=1 Tax=Paraglaciecola aquimarina TaxID=1235557 RepID=A0ABU3T084_9ALTE|nr:hypothetical protein [Paraglaciecola aquimarina]MDU0355669.1 hypothetical protein [Paraglaciecola aquimarina]
MSQSSRCLSQQFLVVVPILKLLGLAVVWLSSGGLQAQDLVDVKQSLIVDIKQAQQRLTLTEKK